MLLSTTLGLNASQPMLDFVDIDLDLDFPLYIDPIGFVNPIDHFAQECQDDIRDFFQAVLQAIIDGDVERGEALLAALQEPNETHLGISQGEPRGRGIGLIQAQQLVENLRASPAARTGLLSDLTDCALFIDGIGADKVSDITTNIIRRHLIEYTQQQFELLGVPIAGDIPTGKMWVRGESRWETDRFDRLPLVDGKRVLLVPKRYVRWKGGMQQLATHYYTHFVTNFIRDEQLRTGGHLVKVIRRKREEKREVYKKDIKADMPPTKRNLAHFSVENPGVYRDFKATVTRRGSLGLRRLMELDGEPFVERIFNEELCRVLQRIPTGRRDATTYHHTVAGIITYMFYPMLITPTLELDINQGRKRIDISFANAAERGFFSEMRVDPFLQAREVMVECKNYTEDLANNEIDQMIGRFDPRRGRLGLVCCRTIENADRLLERCRDAMRAQQGAILVFSDDDFIELLGHHDIGRATALEAMCRRKFRDLLQ
ncbi:hypothetical protein EJC47_19950 [Sphingomonas sp. TF3]|uniref:hypothetical protein n=1 Tax=Sphingomonas sp. TF3 TaxID=2495580 RepID=UPI000F86E3B2|nr:hypothetical protein [Sphingomonas sp. TF3]RUN74735.1 hypothetical protein EJC47_19950 [Sphingomonas sp. TF3]